MHKPWFHFLIELQLKIKYLSHINLQEIKSARNTKPKYIKYETMLYIGKVGILLAFS